MVKRWMCAAVVVTASLVGTACAPDNPYPVDPNQPPVPVASATPTNAAVLDPISFSSAGSYDPDGEIVTYLWTFGDGRTSDATHIDYAYSSPGTYTATLSVTDDGGRTRVSAPISITITAGANRYVATTGVDSGNCAAAAAPCLTINYAIGQATPGETVVVASGSYPEIVVPTKPVVLRGANAGVVAGVGAGSRGAESVIRGVRSAANASASFGVVVDGFTIDPTSDAALLTNATGIVNLFGGSTSTIRNNVFIGASALAPNCSHTCTDMGDYALHVRSGNVDVSNNAFINWRRPLNVAQSDAAAPITSAWIEANSFVGVTSRAMSIGAATGQHNMAGVTVTGNSVDATGRGPSSSPAGITVTNHSNTISNNTFVGLSSGVFINLCKKFSTDDNTVSANRFDSNLVGVNVTTIVDTSQCNSGAAEGAGGWVPGGGAANGLTISDNTFVNQAGFAIRFNPNFGSYPTVITTDAIDARCNWYGAVSGPSGSNSIGQGPAANAQILFSPWLSSDGGRCDTW